MGVKRSPTVRVDPELARLSIGLKLAHLFRIWVVARHLTREDNGSSKVSKRQLKAVLRTFEVVYTRQHLNALLRAGEDLFWNSNRHHLYLRSSQFVAKKLTHQAAGEHPDLLSNKPGVTEVLLSPAGGLEQWESTIYAGWLTHRNNPTISREVLQMLFNRTPETLRHWEETHLSETVTTRTNYAQCADSATWDKVRPARVSSYIASTREGEQARLRWQIPNTYMVKGIKVHRHRGQSKKVRKAVNHQLQQPATLWRGGSPRWVLYFDRAKKLQEYLKEHPGVYYLWRGENRHKHGIFEATETGWSETNAHERVSFSREREINQYEQIPIEL